jgi:hypothetical protein
MIRFPVFWMLLAVGAGQAAIFPTLEGTHIL